MAVKVLRSKKNHTFMYDKDINHWSMGACLALNAATARKSIGISSVIAYIDSPIKLGQILILVSKNHIPIAYCTWAWVSRETLDRIRESDPFLHVSEWRDGRIFCLYDVVAPHGFVFDLIRALKEYIDVGDRQDRFAGNRRKDRPRLIPLGLAGTNGPSPHV